MKCDDDRDMARWMEFPSAGISMGRRWRRVDRLLGEHPTGSVVRWSDVVVYELSGRLIAHRVVRITRDTDGGFMLVTKGDGYWTPDRISVPMGNVKAVIRAVGNKNGMRDVNSGHERWAGWVQALGGWLTSLIWRPLRLTADGHIGKE